MSVKSETDTGGLVLSKKSFTQQNEGPQNESLVIGLEHKNKTLMMPESIIFYVVPSNGRHLSDHLPWSRLYIYFLHFLHRKAF